MGTVANILGAPVLMGRAKVGQSSLKLDHFSYRAYVRACIQPMGLKDRPRFRQLAIYIFNHTNHKAQLFIIQTDKKIRPMPSPMC